MMQEDLEIGSLVGDISLYLALPPGIRHRLIAAVGNLRVRFNIVHGEGGSLGGFCKGKGEG